MSLALSQLEQDALKELFNLGIGRGADSLSRLLQAEVLMSVPYLDVLSAQAAAERIEAKGSQPVAAIRQPFSGPFDGIAMLLFPEAKSLELVRSLLGEDIPLEQLTEMEQESLIEVGNIVLNACLGSFANLMQTEFTFALPDFCKGSCQQLLLGDAQKQQAAGQHPVIFLLVDFGTTPETPEAHEIRGYIILLLSSEATRNLQQQIQTLLNPA